MVWGAICEFAVSNLRVKKARKTGVFERPEKTLNFFRKNACIENPLLISYSPVAPLRATPEGEARRLIFEKRTVLKNAIPRFPREGTFGRDAEHNEQICLL